jgi:hypothetical protein
MLRVFRVLGIPSHPPMQYSESGLSTGPVLVAIKLLCSTHILSLFWPPGKFQ